MNGRFVYVACRAFRGGMMIEDSAGRGASSGLQPTSPRKAASWELLRCLGRHGETWRRIQC